MTDEGWQALVPRDVVEAVAEVEVERLEHLIASVQKWEKSVYERLDCEAQKHGDLDQFGDEAFSQRETSRILYAGIAVAIASISEHVVALACYYNKPGRPMKKENGQRWSWGQLRQAVETDTGKSLNELPGYSSCARARVFANCFKHLHGCADEEVEKNTGIAKGKEIEFENEDWPKMLDDVKVFFAALAELVEDKSVDDNV